MQTRIKIFLNTSAICPYATNTPSFRSIHFNHRTGSRCFLLLFQSYRLGKEPPPSVKVHSFWCRHRRRQAQTWPTCAIDLLVMLVGEVLKGGDVDKREKSVQVKEMVEDTRSGGRAAKRGDRGWMHLTHQNTERTSDCRMRSQRAQPTTTYLIHSLHTYTHTYTCMYIIYIYISMYICIPIIYVLCTRTLVYVYIAFSRVRVSRNMWDLSSRRTDQTAIEYHRRSFYYNFSFEYQ